MQHKDYIKESHDAIRARRLFGSIPITVHNEISDKVDLSTVVATIEKLIPKSLLYHVDEISIGDFSFLNDREINGMYEGGTIYLTNVHDDTADMLDDLVHELSHAVESYLGDDIYADFQLETEFLQKRNTLYNVFKKYTDHKVEKFKSAFMNSEMDHRFDDFLYKEVGYVQLRDLIGGIFISPYSVTSLREYFGKAFEHFYLYDKEKIKKISPVLYSKLDYLDSWGKNEI